MKGPWQWQESSRRWPMGLLLLLSLHASGQNLTLADPSASALQTRTFEHTDSTALIRSSLAIIQDIRFHVIEAESSPVMLVAVSPGAWDGADTETLTISLREDAGVAGSYSIRLSLAAPWISENSAANGEKFEEKFYQDFFSYLHRELFRETSLP
jgi:hypothetical protein